MVIWTAKLDAFEHIASAANVRAGICGELRRWLLSWPPVIVPCLSHSCSVDDACTLHNVSVDVFPLLKLEKEGGREGGGELVWVPAVDTVSLPCVPEEVSWIVGSGNSGGVCMDAKNYVKQNFSLHVVVVAGTKTKETCVQHSSFLSRRSNQEARLRAGIVIFRGAVVPKKPLSGIPILTKEVEKIENPVQ